MTKITLITRMTQPTNIKQNLASSKHCNMALYWLVRVKKFLVWARVQVSQLSSVRRTWHSESEGNAIKKKSRHFGGPYRFHLRRRKVGQGRNQQKVGGSWWFLCGLHFDPVSVSDIFFRNVGPFQTISCYSPDHVIHSHYCENLKFNLT